MMRSSALWREIWRDINSGTAWTIIFTMLASVVLSGLTLTDMLMVSQLNRQAQHFRTVMANVQVLEAPGKVDPAACISLSHFPGVQAASAIRTPQHQVVANALPSSTIRTYEATPGIDRILRVSHAHTSENKSIKTGVYLSQSVAEALGAYPGSVTRLDDQDAHVIGVFPWSEDDGRRPGFAYSMFIPTPPIGNFDECWVDIWPVDPNIESFIRAAVIPRDEPGQITKVYAFNSSLGTTFNGQALLHTRMTVFTPYIIIATGFLLGAASVWRRRLEYSSDLHAGVSRYDLIIKYMWETAAWVTATLILATPVLSAIILRNPSHDQNAMWHLAIIYLTAIATAPLIGAFGAALTIREKHLLRYFKHR